jgi:hypothetical protein
MNKAKAARRYYRSIIISVVALAALVWVAVDQFDIAREEILELFVGSLLALLLVVAGAGAAAFLWILLRKFFRRDNN